jgi:hypothetical protein
VKIYVQIKGVIRGTFSVEQIRRMLIARQVKPTSIALIEGELEWRPIWLVPGLQNAHSLYNYDLGEKRNVSGRLGLGIFFLPHIFSWFTLRQGYSITTRIVAFCWLGGLVILSILSNSQREEKTNFATQSKSYQFKKDSSANQPLSFGSVERESLILQPSFDYPNYSSRAYYPSYSYTESYRSKSVRPPDGSRKSVFVRGHYRKNGTYVGSYYRRSPKRRR